MKAVARRWAMAVALVVPVVPVQAQAQATGRILGRVVNLSDGSPLPGAQLFVNGGVVGALTDLDGRFVIQKVPLGDVEVTARMIGFGTRIVTEVDVVAGEVTVLDIGLEETSIELQGIVVTSAREQGSQAFLLDQRRTAFAMVEAVGSEVIGRRPDSDAADVARRMTGVTVADDKYVFVRGLGERYAQTTLNGSALPSPEPEREVVPLDLFPSGFLEGLRTQTSYTPNLPADFSGGSVEIETKDFPNELTVRIGAGTSVNSKSQFKDGFLSSLGGGRDWLGYDDGTRAAPRTVVDIMGDPSSGQRLPASSEQRVVVAEAFRSLEQGFSPGSARTPINRSLHASVGGRRALFESGELGFVVAGTYSDDYSIRDDDRERKYRTTSFTPAGRGAANVNYLFTRGTRSVGLGSIANVTFKPTSRHKLSLRTTLNRSADDEARRYQGFNAEDIGSTVRAERLRFVSRLISWGQLSGEHQLFDGSRAEWRVALSRATRDEPLLRESFYTQEDDGDPFVLLDISESGRYFWSDLVDDDFGGSLDWTQSFGFLGRDASIAVGGAYRTRQRDFAARRLNWDFLGSIYTNLDAALDTAVIVANARRPGEFAIDEIVEPGDLYDAEDTRVGGYAMLDVPVSGRLQAIAGARVERYELVVDSRGSNLASVERTDVAPSLNLIFSASDRIKIRGAVSRTLDRPEFRELAPFQFTEATSLRQLFGNPELAPARIRSGDLRLDWFPAPGEMISLGGFVKKLENPIEQVYVAAASSAYSFQNADRANVLGVEVDIQLGLARLAPALRDFAFTGNYARIESTVTVVRGSGGFEPTNLERPLEGQAPYVLNLGLDWSHPAGLEAGLFLNRFGKRVTAAGGSGIPDIYEQPRDALDLTLRFPLRGGASARVKATNLLDEPYLFTQSANGVTLTQRTYTVGRTVSVGLSWEF